MSYDRGIAAIHLEMPDTIPHTEYVSHPRLMERVTGLPADHPDSGPEFYRKWDFDFIWRTDSPEFPNAPRTWMGSARYAEDQELKPAEYPFATVEEVLAFDPVQIIGVPDRETTRRIIERSLKDTQSKFDNVVVPTGYYNTVFTWCIVTFGWDLFMLAAMEDPDHFDTILDGFMRLSQPVFEAAAETDAEAFICHDDIVWTAGAVFHPEWYRQYIFPRYRKLWAPLIEAGIPILFCSDGNFTEFVDDVADAGASGFIFEPFTDLEYVAKRYGQTHVIIGNADCRILTYGSADDIRNEVERCTRIGKPLPGYFYAVGNHIPYNVPIENALLYYELIQEYGKR